MIKCLNISLNSIISRINLVNGHYFSIFEQKTCKNISSVLPQNLQQKQQSVNIQRTSAFAILRINRRPKRWQFTWVMQYLWTMWWSTISIPFKLIGISSTLSVSHWDGNFFIVNISSNGRSKFSKNLSVLFRWIWNLVLQWWKFIAELDLRCRLWLS